MKKLAAVLIIFIYILTLNAGAKDKQLPDDVVKISILSTSDLHGNLDGYNYSMGITLPIGLERVKTIIDREKVKNKNTIVIDGGDFNRGNPMVDMYNTLNSDEPNPVINAMNMIGYDGATLGNHEFDYGKTTLFKIKKESKFPIVSANVYYKGKLLFQPYEIIHRNGVKIGLIGFTTTAAKRYNAGDDMEGIEIKNVREQAHKYMDVLKNKEGVDIVIAIVHSGIEGKYKAPEDETDVIKLANLPVKPDVIISGHSHKIISNMSENNVIIQSPGAYGMGVGKIELIVRKSKDSYNIVRHYGEFIPAFTGSKDSEIEKMSNQYRDNTIKYINTPIEYSTNSKSISSVSIINEVKLKEANADVVIEEGIKDIKLKNKSLTVNDMYKLYGRENSIIGVTVKGEDLKKYIELRLKNNPKDYDNLFGVDVVLDEDAIKLYKGENIIRDDDYINAAITRRQYKRDVNLRKSGVSSGKVYYDSFKKYGLNGRVRQRIIATYEKK